MIKLVSKMSETDAITSIDSWIATTLSSIQLDTSHNPVKVPETTLEAMLSLKFISGIPGIIAKDPRRDTLRSKLLGPGFSLIRMDRFHALLHSIKEHLVKEAKKAFRQADLYGVEVFDSKLKNQQYLNIITDKSG